MWTALTLQERQEPPNRAREEFNAAEVPGSCALQAVHDDAEGLFYILYNLNIHNVSHRSHGWARGINHSAVSVNGAS